MEHAVDAQAELAAVLERLEVDVAGAVAQRLLEDLVDHADDPAVLVGGRRSVEVEDVLVGSVRSSPASCEVFGPLADGLGVASRRDRARRAATRRPTSGAISGLIRSPVISCSSSTTPISSGETNATSSTVSRTAIGQISRSTQSFSGRRLPSSLSTRRPRLAGSRPEGTGPRHRRWRSPARKCSRP